jgi:NADH-quinone oxidoreductase subunit E
LKALAAHIGVSAAELYDTASFYSMLRFTLPAKTEIRVCRGTACHSGGNAELVKALEQATGLKLGEENEQFSLGWVECLGQCQAAPNLLVNGKLYPNVNPAKIPELLGGER